MNSNTRRKFFLTASGAAALVTTTACPRKSGKQTGNILRLELDSVSGLLCVRQTPVDGLKLVKDQQKAYVVLLQPSTTSPTTQVTCELKSNYNLDDIFAKRPASNPFVLTQGQPELFIFNDEIGGLEPRDDKFKDTSEDHARTVGLFYDLNLCTGSEGDDNDIHVEC